MSKLQAGFSRVDMTPPLGAHIDGYYFDRYVEGVRDPLYINAVAVREGDKAVVAITLDLMAMWDEPSDALRLAVAEAAGLDPNAILLCCTHSHTGVTVGREKGDQQYFAWLKRRLCDAAVMALQDCKPVEQMLSFEGDCPGTAFVRRFKMRGGYYQTWGVDGDPDMIDWANPGDDSVRFVRILRTGGEEIVLVNFQSHPDNVSGSMVSADYPGFLRNKVETEFPGCKCIYFNGAEGDLICRDYRFASVTREKYTIARIVGHKLADFVLAHMEEATPVETTGVAFGRREATCSTKWDPEKLPEAERIIDIHENGNEEEELGPDWVATPMVAEAYRIRDLSVTGEEYTDIHASGLAFGGLAFLGVSGEPFCQLGVRIRKASPYAVTFVCCMANGYGDYYPTDEAYDQGGYEPACTRLARGCGGKLVQESNQLLQSLWEEKV